MKKRTLFFLLLLILLGLTACGATTDVNEFSQVYSEYALQYLNDWKGECATVWAQAEGFAFEAAGLDAVSGHLTARYSDGERRFEIELEPLDAAQCQLIEDRAMPLLQMRGNAATPEAEIEILVPGDAVHPYYALWLRSEDMSEGELTASVSVCVGVPGCDANRHYTIDQNGFVQDRMERQKRLHLLFNGGVFYEDGEMVGNYSEHLIAAGGDTLHGYTRYIFGDDAPTGKWLIQRFRDGYWHDTTICGSGLGEDFALELDLVDGYYRIVLAQEDGREAYYPFGVGSLENLTGSDLPHGVREYPVDGLWLETEHSEYATEAENFYYRVRNTTANSEFWYGLAHYFEICLDGAWRQIPFSTDEWDSIGCTSIPEIESVPPEFSPLGRNDLGRESTRYLFPFSAGKYRITVSGSINHDMPHTLAAEFTITE